MKRSSLTEEAVDGIAWQSFAIGANVALRTVILIILTRSLPPKDFGIIAAAMVVISVTTVLSEMGVARVLVQKLTLTKGMEKSAFAISLYMGLFASLVIYLTAPLTSRLFAMEELTPYVEFLSIILFINAISITAQSLTQRERRFRAMGLIELGAFLVGFGLVALPLAQSGYGAWSLAIGYFVQSIVKLVAFWFTRTPTIGLIPREGTKELLFTGAGFMVGQAGNFVARQVDYLIVGRALGPVPLGFYNRAYQFLMLPAQMFGTATAKVLFPSVASIQEDNHRVARAFTRALGVIAMLTLPATGFLIIIGPELVLTLFGETWSGMIVPFQILIASLLFRTSYKISDSISLALGSMYQRAWRQWVYAAAVATGTIIGTRWGLEGVAAGVCAAVILNFLIMTRLAITITQVDAGKVALLHFRHLAVSVGYSAIIYAAVFAARSVGWSEPAILGVGTIVAVACALTLWFGFRSVFGEDGEWFASILESRLPFFRRETNSAKISANNPNSQTGLTHTDHITQSPRQGKTSSRASIPAKRRKTDVSIDQAIELSREVGRRISAMQPQPDISVGLANGGILPALVASKTAGLDCTIIRVRRRGSRIKQRFRVLRKLLHMYPFVLQTKFVKRTKRSFDRKFDQIEEDGWEESGLDVSGLHLLIIDDCVDSGSTAGQVRERLLSRGAASVRVAAISWGTKFDSMNLHNIAPDIYLGRTIDIYPWALESPHYDEFEQWLNERGYRVWV